MLDSQIIPKKELFQNQVKSLGKISPDGQWLAWIELWNNIQNIWIAPIHSLEQAKVITQEKKRGIADFNWCYDNENIIFIQDNNGDENWKIWVCNINTLQAHNLTAKYIRAKIIKVSPLFPTKIVILVNLANTYYQNIYIVDIKQQTHTLLIRNCLHSHFLISDDLNIIVASRTDIGGSSIIEQYSQQGYWKQLIKYNVKEARFFALCGMNKLGTEFYILDSQESETKQLLKVSLDNCKKTIIMHHHLADIIGYLEDYTTYEPIAYIISHEKIEIIPMTDWMQKDAQSIQSYGLKNWSIINRSLDGNVWIIYENSDITPGNVFLYNRQTKQLSFLYNIFPNLKQFNLYKMYTQTVIARDGLPLLCYYTLPSSYNSKLPLIVLVHGGPWDRDVFGFSPLHQWLASRGYAVLSVNFRSSTGLGKTIFFAGDGQWGGKMNDDLEDAVKWMISHNMIDITKIGIMGASYGGYAVLSSLTKKNNIYACGIDMFGPSNLVTLLNSIPIYWEHERIRLYQAIGGNPKTQEGNEFLKKISPFYKAENIQKPLLIIQGENDPRVPRSESDQINSVLKNSHNSFLYIVYKNEGHSFFSIENYLSCLSIIENFLSMVINGKKEELSTDDLTNENFEVITGNHIYQKFINQ